MDRRRPRVSLDGRSWVLVPVVAGGALLWLALREARGTASARTALRAQPAWRPVYRVDAGPPPPPPSPARPRRRWYRKKRYWLPVAIVLGLIIAMRLLLPPLLESHFQKELTRMKGYSGTFAGMDVSFLRLKLSVRELALDKVPSPDPAHPFALIKLAEVDLLGHPLLRGKIVASARFLEPRFHIITPLGKKEDVSGKEKKDEKGKERREERPPTEAPDIAAALREIFPMKFDRVEISKGEMVLVDAADPDRPEIRIGEIEATIENIETGTQLGNGRPSVFAARAKLQGSGEMTAFYTADLLAEDLTFAGQAKLKGLLLEELNGFLSEKAKMRFEKGELDVYSAFSVMEGKIKGGVKPLIKDAGLESVDEGVIADLRAALADAALSLLSDRVPERKAVAGIVPIEGKLSNPQAPVLPTVLSIIRNAFVEGLAAGFVHLPPAEEEK